MTIREKTTQQRAQGYFRSAGLGGPSAIEAARLLCESGVSFETAAVLGQRSGDASTATSTSIREAARRYASTTHGRSTKTSFGRALSEGERQALGEGETSTWSAFGRPVAEAKGSAKVSASRGRRRGPGKLPAFADPADRTKVTEGRRTAFGRLIEDR